MKTNAGCANSPARSTGVGILGSSSFFYPLSLKKKAAALSLKSRDIFCVAPNCSRKSPGNGKERNITLLLSKIQNSGVHGRDSGTCKDNHF